jgi:hypothetical protein
MDELRELAKLIHERNLLDVEISNLIGRPATIGHVGEFIAAKIFNIELEESATHKGIDGRFQGEPLQGRSVNVKWYPKQEGLLDITPDSLPDYYLVLAGPRSPAESSRGKTRPWLIKHVYLFETKSLMESLQKHGIKIGAATSVRQYFWDQSEIYPLIRTTDYLITNQQYKALALFDSTAHE